MAQNFAARVLDFNSRLEITETLPAGVSVINPFSHEETLRVSSAFYEKYYSDEAERVAIFGINPGRFGAGVTGVPFTDPAKLEIDCGITNSFDKKAEASSNFVYEVVNAWGGPEAFYQHYFIGGVCPLGFLKDGKNYNFYDSPALRDAVLPFIVRKVWEQIELGLGREVCYILGKGQNFAFFEKLNKQHQFFERLVALPHPRWVMQYRFKRRHEFADEFVQILTPASK